MSGMRKESLITILIFLLLILLRLPGLDNSPAEYHSWRQSDTEAMARNLLEQKFNIFYPQLNYDGAPPNYAQLELQITTFLIAGLYGLIGHYYFLARIIPLLFFLGSAYYLYRIGKEAADQLTGWLALVIYGTFPFCLFFSRAIMPESAALLFMTAGFYYFMVWQKKENNRLILIFSAFLTALAITQKIPAIYLGLPMAYLILRKHGFKALRTVSVWLYALIALLPPAIYFIWLQGVAQTDYVSGIAMNLLLPAWQGQIFSSAARTFLKQALFRAYTPLALMLAFIGLFFLRDQKSRFLISWFLAATLEIIFVATIIRLDYYLILVAPLIALLAAITLHHLLRYRLGWSVCGLILFLILLRGCITMRIFTTENQTVLNQAKILQENTDADELIVISVFSPELLNLSRRYGFRANIFYPQNPQREMLYFKEQGADYFVIINGQVEGDDDGSYLRYLHENYQIFALSPDVQFIKI